MQYNNLFLDPTSATKIMKEFEDIRKTKELMENNFTREDIVLLYCVCYIRTDGLRPSVHQRGGGREHHKIAMKLLVDLINMLCIMKKYKKGGSRDQVEEYDPPEGTYLYNIKGIILGGLGVACCFIGLANAFSQISENSAMFYKEVGSIEKLMKTIQKDWDTQSARLTTNLLTQYNQAIIHDPTLEDQVLANEEARIAALSGDEQNDSNPNQLALLPDLNSNQLALPEDGIDTSYGNAIKTWKESVPKLLIAENTVAQACITAVALSFGQALPPSFGLNLEHVLESMQELQGTLDSAFEILTKAAKTSQPASLMRRFADTQALIMTGKKTWTQVLLSRDSSHASRSISQLIDLQDQVLTGYGDAALKTFTTAKSLTKGKINIMKTNVQVIINNLSTIYRLMGALMVAVGILKKSIQVRRSDGDSPELNPVYLYDRRQLSIGRSKRKKKPVTHKKPKDKKKGKKSKGKRGTTKGKIRKTRRK